MSKMSLHGSFGHLQHKLCAKERPKVKLALWLPTTKSRESTRPRCVQRGVQHTVGKLSRRDTSLLETSFQLEVLAKSYDLVKSRESKPGQFRDSTLGVPGQKAIWMCLRWSNAQNTIWGKVVTSPKFGPWWIKWVYVARWRVPKFLGRPTWRSNYVETRKELELGVAPDFQH
jgi:hypothetical protein